MHIAIYSREHHLFSKFYDLNSIVVTIVNYALLKIRYTTWKDILVRRLMLTSLLFEFVCSYGSDNIYQNIDGFLQVRFEKHLGRLQNSENISIGFNGAQNSMKT